MDLIEQFIEGKENLDALSKRIPCHIHINEIDEFRLIYVDPKSKRQYSDYTDEEFKMFQETLSLVHPDDLEKAKEACSYYLENLDSYSTVSFIQRVQNIKNLPYRAYYTTSILIEELGGLVSFSVYLGDIEVNDKQVKKIVEETAYIKRNLSKISALSKKELNFIKLWSNNVKNLEIAKKMSITEQTVKSYKKRVYKKLDLHSFNELVEFASAFDMVL